MPPPRERELTTGSDNFSTGGGATPENQVRLLQALCDQLEIAQSGTSRPSWVESHVDPNVDVLLEWLRSSIKSAQFYSRHSQDSFSAELGVAIRDSDPNHPGNDTIIFRTKDGVETCYTDLPVGGLDPSQSAAPAGVLHRAGSDSAHQPLSHDDYWAVLTDPKALAGSRVTAFTELHGSPLEDKALSFLAEELTRVDIPSEWRDVAVFAAEDSHFPEVLRKGVGEALLNIASALRNRPDAPEKVVWSALRRGASLLPATKVDRLLAFLAPGGTVDTRSVALQCVARMYEVEPPIAIPVAVADRAHRFAERFLDPDVFTPGEPSLIARNAVSALAAVGDQRLGDTLVALRSLGRSWLVRRVSDELNRVYRGWVSRGFPQEHPAVANLRNALASLN